MYACLPAESFVFGHDRHRSLASGKIFLIRWFRVLSSSPVFVI
uniref:Uncharacterized protein n=1 Tax=Arundo donax TaxID=35708 RepID=A0A0A9GTB6_ARUDO